MNDVERLMRQDRVAGVPEPPDLRYTEAAVRRRLGLAPGAGAGAWARAGAGAGARAGARARTGAGTGAGAGDPAAAQGRRAASAALRAGGGPYLSPDTPSAADSPVWWMAAAALALFVPLAWVLSYIGLSPWWLAALPVSLLPLTPLLLMKERERS